MFDIETIMTINKIATPNNKMSGTSIILPSLVSPIFIIKLFIVIVFISAVRTYITEVVFFFSHISMTELTRLFSVIFVKGRTVTPPLKFTTHNFLYICIAGVCNYLLEFVENK